MENINFDSLKRRRDLRIILPVFLVSIIACIDRVNISYAKLTMTQTLSWLSPEVYGFGAGIFFAGYLLLEIPGSLFAAKFSASKWISRIMFTWGIVSLCMAFVTTEWQFYLCRFLLGASEASLYPVIYSLLFPRWFTAAERARATSLMLTSLLLLTIIGAPIAGVLLEHSFFGLLGWQELFILESYFLWVVGFWGFYFWMPTVLKNLSGWSTSLIGGAIAIPMMAALVVQLVIGHTATVTGDKVWHVFGALAVGAVGLGLSPFAHNMGVALFLICLSAIGIHASMGVWWTIPTTFLSGPAAAGSIALINSCGNLGGMFGPNMMAWVQAQTGSFDMGYYLMAAFMFCAGLLVLTLKYKVNGAAKKDVLLDAKANVQPTVGH